MSPVLADSGPLYALVDRNDGRHQDARQQLARLEELDLRVVVAQPILLESYTLILRKLGCRSAQLWLKELAAGAELLNPTAEDYRDARRRLAEFGGQDITLFDATLVTLAERLEVPVWTYDYHFDVMRAEIWRGP